MSTELLTTFDYTALDAETRIVVQQRTSEIRDRVKSIQRSTIEIGQRLIEIKQRLGHGPWGTWLAAEFQWSSDTAENLMRAARLAAQNPKFSEFEDQFAKSALYLLAADSTPEPARVEALERAERGETIGHREAKEIVQATKAGRSNGAAAPPPASPALDDIRAAIAAGPHRWDQARALIGQLSPTDRPDWHHDLHQVEVMDRELRRRDAPAAWTAFQALLDPTLRGLLAPLYANAAAQLGLVWPPAGEAEEAGFAEQEAATIIAEIGGQYLGMEGEDYRAAWPEGGAPRAYSLADLRSMHAEAGFEPVGVAPDPAEVRQAQAISSEPLTEFIRRTLLQKGWEPTGQTREDDDGVWHYELIAPPTGSGKRAALWKTRAAISAIIRGAEPVQEAPPAAPEPAPEPAPAGRQPYGAAGSGRWQPIVPHVLIIGERTQHYAPPPIHRAATIYDTATTVRCQRGDKPETQAGHKVWCVLSDEAWHAIEQAHAAFATALDDLAQGLRDLGRYADRLVEAGGMKQAPNPLCLTVARIDDPDKREYATWGLTAWHVPRLKREPVERHTPKMLAGGAIGGYTFSQADSFVLADDAAWRAIEARYDAALGAAEAMEALLAQLGAYSEAVADGRYSTPATAPVVEAPAGLPADFADHQRRVEALGARLEIAANTFVVVEGRDATQFVGWPECTAYIHAMEAEDAPAPPVAVVEAAEEDLDAQIEAAGRAIIAGLPEPACRLLARLTCFTEEAEAALTAPIEVVRTGFEKVWGMNIWIGEDEAPALRALLAQLASVPALPPRPAVAARGDVSEQLRELRELRAWADTVIARQVV